MKKLLILLLLPVFAQAQVFPSIDSALKYNDKYSKSAIQAFTFNRLHTLLKGTLQLIGEGGGGSNARDTFRVNGGFIQYQEVGASTWNNLIAVSDITGPQGVQGIQGPAGSDATATTNASALTSGTLDNARLSNIPQSTVSGLVAALAAKATQQALVDSSFAIRSAIAGGGSVTIDPTPTDGSANAVSSNGVYDADQLRLLKSDTSSMLDPFYALLNNKQPLNSVLTLLQGLTPQAGNVIMGQSGAWASRTSAQAKIAWALDNVNNTSDANKPVSTAQQTALDLKVNIDGSKVLSDINFSTAKDTKLTGIATGATANSSDATLLSRANHTGTQAQSTVLGLVDSIAAHRTALNETVDIDVDATPTLGSTNPAQSGGIRVKLDSIVTAISGLGGGTIDATPTNGSTSAVQSDGVFDALATKQGLDADLTTIAGLTATTDNFLVSVASAWASRTPAQVKTTLALNNVDNTSNTTERAATATLTNKTLTAPVLSGTLTGTYTIGGTPTFPAAVTQNTATQTLTNKRWTARVGSTTSSATPTINTDNFDVYKLTAQTADITSFTTNLTGTPVDGDVLEIQVTGTGSRALTFGASFVASTVPLPTTTSGTTTLTVIFQYFSTSSYGNAKWVCVNSF